MFGTVTNFLSFKAIRGFLGTAGVCAARCVAFVHGHHFRQAMLLAVLWLLFSRKSIACITVAVGVHAKLGLTAYHARFAMGATISGCLHAKVIEGGLFETPGVLTPGVVLEHHTLFPMLSTVLDVLILQGIVVGPLFAAGLLAQLVDHVLHAVQLVRGTEEPPLGRTVVEARKFFATQSLAPFVPDVNHGRITMFRTKPPILFPCMVEVGLRAAAIVLTGFWLLGP
mmetsp:Transcript_4860/g.6673  ORF Transcript_4860/g.6673 Transcript_4860/m.6673 type:complete len:226 (-) Transcript_4860:1294-1971(-)